MVRSAGFTVRNKVDARMLAEEITAEDVTEAIGLARLNGGLHATAGRGNDSGRQFLKAVDSSKSCTSYKRSCEESKTECRDNSTLLWHTELFFDGRTR
jgi:hypothetical protein